MARVPNSPTGQVLKARPGWPTRANYRLEEVFLAKMSEYLSVRAGDDVVVMYSYLNGTRQGLQFSCSGTRGVEAFLKKTAIASTKIWPFC